MTTRPSRSFVVSRTPANLAADRRIGFTVQGLDTVWANRLAFQRGDLIAVYVVRPFSGFVATAEITSDAYHDDSPIWARSRSGDPYATRYQSKPRVVVADEQIVSARELVPELSIARYLRDPDRWGMLFGNAVRQIPDSDFELIELALRGSAEEVA